MIRDNSTYVIDVKRGYTGIDKIYVGDNLVWKKSTETYGFFIQDVSGNLYYPDEWFVGKDEEYYLVGVNGIAVILPECQFLMSLGNNTTWHYSGNYAYPYQYGYNCYSLIDTVTPAQGVKWVSNVGTTWPWYTSVAAAESDYAGKSNTEYEVAHGRTGTGYDSYINYTFPNGDKGYIPSMGQLRIMYDLIRTPEFQLMYNKLNHTNIDYANGDFPFIVSSIQSISHSYCFVYMVSSTAYNNTDNYMLYVGLEEFTNPYQFNEINRTLTRAVNSNTSPRIYGTIPIGELQNSKIPPILKSFMAEYDITDTTAPTDILYSTDGLHHMIVDNGSAEDASIAYQFSSTGTHSIMYYLEPGFSIIPDNMFNDIQTLKAVNISNSIKAIGQNAFYNCQNLEDVSLGGVTGISVLSFYRCYSLNDMDFSNMEQFSTNSLTACTSFDEVTFPAAITEIPEAIFASCTGMTKFVANGDITTIGQNAFYNCPSCILYDFTHCTTVPALGNSNVFYNINANAEIKVPNSLYNTWVSSTYWTTYANKIVAV